MDPIRIVVCDVQLVSREHGHLASLLLLLHESTVLLHNVPNNFRGHLQKGEYSLQGNAKPAISLANSSTNHSKAIYLLRNYNNQIIDGIGNEWR